MCDLLGGGCMNWRLGEELGRSLAVICICASDQICACQQQ